MNLLLLQHQILKLPLISPSRTKPFYASLLRNLHSPHRINIVYLRPFSSNAVNTNPPSSSRPRRRLPIYLALVAALLSYSGYHILRDSAFPFDLNYNSCPKLYQRKNEFLKNLENHNFVNAKIPSESSQNESTDPQDELYKEPMHALFSIDHPEQTPPKNINQAEADSNSISSFDEASLNEKTNQNSYSELQPDATIFPYPNQSSTQKKNIPTQTTDDRSHETYGEIQTLTIEATRPFGDKYLKIDLNQGEDSLSLHHLSSELRKSKARISKLKKSLRRAKMLYNLELHSRTDQLVLLSSRFQTELSLLERGIYTQYVSSVKPALVNLEKKYEEQLSAFKKQEHAYSIDRLNSLEQFLKKASYYRSEHIHSISKRTDTLVSAVGKYEQLIQDYQTLCSLYKSFTLLQQRRQHHPSLPFDCYWEQVKETGNAIPYLKNVILSVADEMDPASKVGIESSEILLREFETTSNQVKYAIRAQNVLDAFMDTAMHVANYVKALWYSEAEKLETQRNILSSRMERMAILNVEQALVNERSVSENKKLEIGIKLIEQLKSKDKMFYKNWLEKAKNAVEIECIMQLLLDELNNYTSALGSEIESQKRLMEQLSKNSSSN